LPFPNRLVRNVGLLTTAVGPAILGVQRRKCPSPKPHICEHCQIANLTTGISKEKRWRDLCDAKGAMLPSDEEIDAITETIIACAIEVHRVLGPGLLESVYRDCLVLELKYALLSVESERHVPFEYKGQPIPTKLKLDLLANGCVVVELKAVESLHPVHSAQVITYLKLTGCPAGLLLNFKCDYFESWSEAPRSSRPL
jgi:GxxExxY protein